MTFPRRLRSLLWAIALIAAALPSARAKGNEELAKHLVVVYNTNSPHGAELAQYYAKARNIPAERLLGIACPDQEEISRAQYREIEKAIRDALMAKQWLGPATVPAGKGILTTEHNDVWCLLLIQGIPLKVANDGSVNEPPPKLAALNTNAASVDSELATLPSSGLPLTGVVTNPYFAFMGSHPFDELDAHQIILVGRLDGPSAGDVRRMIDDALYAEAHRLAGRAYVDTQGLPKETRNSYYEGDQWFLTGAAKLAEAGWDVEIDRQKEIYPENLPWRDVAIYGGWYAEKAAGPFMRDTGSPVFARGAIAYHLHSYSAETLRTATEHWCGPLIAHGAAATMGCVYEPYLDLTPHWDVFIDRLLDGSTFIEAAYASEKGLSWMTTFIGDPLYTPFKVPLDQAITDLTSPPATRDFLRLQSIRRQLAEQRLGDAQAGLAAMEADPNLTSAGWEGIADLLTQAPFNMPGEALADYAKAAAAAATAPDAIRVRFKEIALAEKLHRLAEARQLIAQTAERYPEQAAYFDLATRFPSPAGNDTAPVAGTTPASPAPAPAPASAPARLAPAMGLKPSVSSSPSIKPAGMAPSP